MEGPLDADEVTPTPEGEGGDSAEVSVLAVKVAEIELTPRTKRRKLARVAATRIQVRWWRDTRKGDARFCLNELDCPAALSLSFHRFAFLCAASGDLAGLPSASFSPEALSALVSLEEGL